VALLGLFQPFIEPSIWAEVRRPRSRYSDRHGDGMPRCRRRGGRRRTVGVTAVQLQWLRTRWFACDGGWRGCRARLTFGGGRTGLPCTTPRLLSTRCLAVMSKGDLFRKELLQLHPQGGCKADHVTHLHGLMT
jgi:hypothetical protein